VNRKYSWENRTEYQVMNEVARYVHEVASLGILFWYPEKYGIWQPFVFRGTTYCNFYCISLQHLWLADSKNDQIWTI